jgi:microcystin-dependent protein
LGPGPSAAAGLGASVDAGGGGASNPIKNFTGNSGSTGSGTAHNNMQPYIVKNKIMRVL